MKLIKMLTPPVKASITSFGFALLAALSVQAASIAYNGANNGDWFAPENWDSQQVPTADDDVTIGNGKAVKAQTGAIAVKSLTITGTGSALYLGKSDLAPQTIAAISGNLTVTEGAKLYVSAGALTDLSVFKDAIADQTVATAAIYAHPTVVSVGGTFSVSGGAVVYPENEMQTGAAVFFKPKDFVLAADGTIDTRNLGWYRVIMKAGDTVPAGAREEIYQENNHSYSFDFGAGHEYHRGAGYGGKAYSQVTVSNVEVPWQSGCAYGSAYAPFLSGSQPGNWANSYCRASGSIVVLATGSVTLNGTLNADGQAVTCDVNGKSNTSKYVYAAPSGGGIWICGRTVEIDPAAVLTAKGADVQNNSGAYFGCGAGGRISVAFDVGPENWAALADSTTLPQGYAATDLREAYSGVFVQGGAMNFGDSPNRSEEGTATYVTYMEGKTSLAVSGEPLAAISEGVNYGTFSVRCGEELSYSAAAYGYDPANLGNVRYSLAGWTLTDKDGATAASGTTAPAVFTLVQENGPYVLTWQWNNREARHEVKANGPGTLTVNGVDVGTGMPIWSATSGEGTETLVATADDGATFVGWFGVPGGKATSETVEVSGAEGEVYVAVFAADSPVLSDKTWVGGTTGSWEDPAAWSPAGVPTLADDVKIASGACFVPQGAVAHSLDISADAQILLASVVDYRGLVEETRGNRATSRFVYVADDLTCAGTAYFGAENAAAEILWLETGGDFRLTGSSVVEITAVPCRTEGPVTTNALYQAATVVHVGGVLSLADTARLEPHCDGFTGTAVRFEPETLFVAEGAKISADTLGWKWRAYEGDPDPRAIRSGNTSGSAGFETCAFGAGWDFHQGGGHAAPGNFDKGSLRDFAGQAYGFAAAPFLPGSPNGVYNKTLVNSSGGGGVVWIKCRYEATINGSLTADAVAMTYGSASGGSVWLLATGLSAGSKSVLSANAGDVTPQNYNSAGAGGRVCLALGLSDEDVEVLAAGEMPSGVTVTEGISLIRATAAGGYQTNNGGKAEDGTLMTLVGAQANVTVNVAGDPLQAVGPEPPYGAQSFAAGRTVTFRATAADGYGRDPADPENVRYACTGFVVKDASGAVLTNGTESVFDYVIPEEESTVTWFWTARETAVHIDNPQGETFGTIRINGADNPQGGSAWGLPDGSATVEAVPADGYEFLYWSGEFPYGQAKVNPLVISTAKTRRMRPIFRLAEEPTNRIWKGTAQGFGVNAGIHAWLDPLNWEPANIPGLEDDVAFHNNGAVCFATNNYIEVKSLTMDGYGKLWIGAMSEYASHSFRQGEGWFTTRLTPATEELSLVVTGNFSMTNNAEVSLGVGDQGAYDRLVVGGDMTLAEANKLQIVGGRTSETFTFARGAGELTVGGTLAVRGTACIYPVSDRMSGGSVVMRATTVEVAEGASICADLSGYGFYHDKPEQPPDTVGVGESYWTGGGYGGHGRSRNTEPYYSDTYGRCYGSAFAPVHPGSSSGFYSNDSMRGGGLIRIHAESIVVNGRLTADAPARNETGYRIYGGGSGGGIWLTADEFSFGPNALISAKGGDSNYYAEGGGGRIAIARGLSDELIEAMAVSGGSEGCHRGKLDEFLKEYPGLKSEQIRFMGGIGGSAAGTYVHYPEVTAGTFRYMTPPHGIVLIVK